MKIALVIGWILFVLEVLIAGALMLRRPGSDSVGQAIAQDLWMVLVPVLVVVGGLFIWGQRGGPRTAFWVAWTIIALPLILGAWTMISGGTKQFGRAVSQQRASRFADATLTRLGRAIEDADVAAVSEVVAAGGIDWMALNGNGKTALAVAVGKAVDYGAPRASVEIVRILLKAGAFPKGAVPVDSALGDQSSARALVLAAFGSSNGRPNAVEVLDLLLSAGGDPNARPEDGQPMYFSTYRGTESLEVLARHGADFTGDDPSYSSRKGMSPAAWALVEKDWDHALFLLEHGVSPDHDAGNGLTARQVIDQLDPSEATDARVRRLKRLIGETPTGGFVKREPVAGDSVVH